MVSRKPILALTLALVACLACSLLADSARAQLGGGGGGGLGGGGAGGGGIASLIGNTGGANGVIVDAEGVLRKQSFPDPNGQLHRQRIAAARAKLDPKIARASELRMVSLNRLEAAIADRLAKQQSPTEEMACLAGLTRLRYVFFYPETNDIVIAGPAEAWIEDLSGRLMGLESGRPVLELQDLVVALRAFPPAARNQPVILCSIDPTPEGLARMQDFLRSVGSRATPGDTQMIVDGLRSSLGLQNIRVGGIPANTHFAQVMIEADYRMKLIGIGLERPPVRFASYVDRANPGQVSRNALQRWFFVPDYKCVRVSEDKLGMELVGNGVRLISEDQVVGQDGSRQVTGRTSRASQGFVDDFTKKYPEIAARTPIYAQLRNVVDLAVAAAFIQQHGYYDKADWRMRTFSDEHALPVETLNMPLKVETVVTSVWKGHKLMTPIGGGVTMRPTEALQSTNLVLEDTAKVAEVRSELKVQLPAKDQWWWDGQVEQPAKKAAVKKTPATKPAAKKAATQKASR